MLFRKLVSCSPPHRLCSRFSSSLERTCSQPKNMELDLERAQAMQTATDGICLLHQYKKVMVDVSENPKSEVGVSADYLDGKYLTETKLSQGCGFVISADGLIATNAHMLCHPGQNGKFEISKVWVTSIGQKNVKYRQGILRPCVIDTGVDLAIGKLPRSIVKAGLDHVFQLDFHPRMGQSVFAIGHPISGPYSGRCSTVTCSSRSFYPYRIPLPNLKKVPKFFCYLETGLAMSSGFSGSPVVNSAGLVIGVHQSSTDGTPKVSHEILSVELDLLLKWSMTNPFIFRHGDGIEDYEIEDEDEDEDEEEEEEE